MKKCVVCIPVYKTELNIFEKISLQQCSYILKNYEKVFLVPESLTEEFRKIYKTYRAEGFPDLYFLSVKSYSEMCLTEALYERFQIYDYMLLYHLDSFVFYDRLKYFCGLGYDYIGAPIPYMGYFEEMGMCVGNGGFSLRNIKRTLKLLRDQRDLLHHSKLSGVFQANEDVFFGYCGAQDAVDFRVPDAELAGKFAQEIMMEDYEKGMQKENLPFGIHAWGKVNYHIWKPLVESYGYQLPPEGEKPIFDDRAESRRWKTYQDILKRQIGETGKDKLKIPFRSLSIWGAGGYGKRCIRVMQALGIRVSHVFDWNNHALDDSDDLDYPVYPPTLHNLMESRDMLVVAIREMGDEIRHKTGMLGESRFLSYDDFMEIILNSVSSV